MFEKKKLYKINETNQVENFYLYIITVFMYIKIEFPWLTDTRTK